jgi:hypothetical protein
MTIATIDSKDQRSVKSVQLAADAGQWLRFRGRDGRKAYGVPSQGQTGLYYLTDLISCTCPDTRYGRAHGACKHVRAVRLYVALVQATVAERAA